MSASVALNIPMAARILPLADGSSALDKHALTAALRALLQRHPALRTAYGAGSDGRPFQHITSQTEFRVTEEDAVAAVRSVGRDAPELIAQLLRAQLL